MKFSFSFISDHFTIDYSLHLFSACAPYNQIEKFKLSYAFFYYGFKSV